MTWKDDDDLTVPKDGEEGYPALSRVLESARPGDQMTFRFHNEGRQIETEHGKAVVFDVTPINSDVPLQTKEGDNAKIDGGEKYAFITGSARLLGELASVADIEDSEIAIEVNATGMDADYTVGKP